MTSFDPVMMNPSSMTVLWEGASADLTNLATGGRVAKASYKLTEDAVQFSSGVLSSREEIVPLWAVRDVDFSQTLTQRARNVADLTLKIDPNAGVYGTMVLVLKSIKEPRQVRELILRQANTIREHWNRRRHEMEVERTRAGASQIYAAAPAPSHAAPDAKGDMMQQLTKLAEMKSAGLLTDEEFAAAKAKLLG